MMNRIRIGRPRARSERPWPGHPRRTRRTRISPGPRRVRRPRVAESRRDTIAWVGRPLWSAVRTVIRAVRMAHDEQVHMWECLLLTSGAAPLTAAAPPADLPAIFRAAGPSPAAARTQSRAPRRRPANVRSSPLGKNLRAHHRQPAHRQAAGQQLAEHPGQGAARVRRFARAIYICHYVAGEEPRRGVTLPAQQAQEPARAAPRPVRRPVRATCAAAAPATRPTSCSASNWSPTPAFWDDRLLPVARLAAEAVVERLERRAWHAAAEAASWSEGAPLSYLTRKQLRVRELGADERALLDFCDFQPGTVRDCMEPPGSPELEDRYRRYVTEPDVNRWSSAGPW